MTTDTNACPPVLEGDASVRICSLEIGAGLMFSKAFSLALIWAEGQAFGNRGVNMTQPEFREADVMIN